MKYSPASLCVAISAIVLVACVSEGTERDLYLGQRAPGMEPEIFSPGVVSTENYGHSPAVFSPDLKTVYWTHEKQDPTQGIIMFSSYRNGVWTEPAAASFGAEFTNDTPYMTADGNTMFFCSLQLFHPIDLLSRFRCGLIGRNRRVACRPSQTPAQICSEDPHSRKKHA